MKNPLRALENEAENGSAAVSKNPKEAFSTVLVLIYYLSYW